MKFLQKSQNSKTAHVFLEKSHFLIKTRKLYLFFKKPQKIKKFQKTEKTQKIQIK